jgi:hypothetical protein
MKEFQMKKLVVIFLLVLVACGAPREESPVRVPELPPGAVTLMGEGERTFLLHITNDEGNTSAWQVSTAESKVGAALLELGFIAGEETRYGLMVTTVHGITTDFAADGSWWGFYINGEFAMVGVDEAYIAEGATYAFVFTR